MMSVRIPNNVWIEWHDLNEPEARDVIVEMEDGTMFTAVYVTFGYLERQMMLNHALSLQIPDAPPVYHAVVETPHVIIPTLDRDIIEDSIDNLLAQDTFESVFTRVTETEEDTDEQPPAEKPTNPKRATQEIAAVFLNEVLLVETNDTRAL
jgi:hypothetical protein